MNLLWITENYPPGFGGMAISAQRIVSGLTARGIHIDVVHLSKHTITQKRASKSDYYYLPVHADESHTLNLLAIMVEELVALKKYDYIVAFGGYLPMNATPVLSAWHAIPYALLIRGNDFDSSIFSSRKMHILDRAIGLASRIAVVSNDKVHRIQSLWNKSVDYIPNGINVEMWTALPSDKTKAAEIKDKLNPDGARIIGVFGHLKPKKGLEVLISSVSNSSLSSSFMLYMVGYADAELMAMVQNSGIRYVQLDAIIQSELPAHYLACDVVAIPSLYDDMPNVALEALALGVPLLASDIDGLKVLLEGTDCGWLFRKGSETDLQKALIQIMNTSAAGWKVKQENAVKLVREYYNPEIETERYISFFNN